MQESGNRYSYQKSGIRHPDFKAEKDSSKKSKRGYPNSQTNTVRWQRKCSVKVKHETACIKDLKSRNSPTQSFGPEEKQGKHEKPIEAKLQKEEKGYKETVKTEMDWIIQESRRKMEKKEESYRGN